MSLLAVVGLLVAAAMPALAADNELNVGQFLQQFARHKNLNATDARIAADSLRAVGVKLPRNIDLGARLTESRVVEIAQAAGLPVSTTNPDGVFGQERVDQFFEVFGPELTFGSTEPVMQTRTRTFDPFSKGNGKHKGHGKGHRTPSEPE